MVLKTIESEEVPLFLLLEKLSDVRNFGAIIRTAECTGVHGISYFDTTASTLTVTPENLSIDLIIVTTVVSQAAKSFK